ncbi:MAG: flagellar biosynthesis protein FlhA [Deferribacteraceae bacterium]|jgi:flagellar biosynthesis protein FlhA|nr:flagellar biosynthesis protein FlhA [Deferribacteraceae bacterium]
MVKDIPIPVAVPDFVRRIGQQTDVALAIAVLGIIIVMIVPVPPVIMDVLLTLSISLSVIILLVSLYIIKPLEFSSFPFVLLMATLFRLALSVATTRLILLNGGLNGGNVNAAGKVIMAFGQFVVGGNFVVGLVIFAILILVNFMVITKGSGRVAEVAARFTLDAMPGKQMSIDADLNAGVIDENEARRRREEVRREADFYGSMDGASKFVRGDAVAGLIITAVDIIGGLVVGVVQNGMSIAIAASTFTILTVGDGLVSQIPALIVSTAAGIVVTRAGSGQEQLSKQLANQLFPHARILFISGGVMLFFAIVPGMPKLSFIFIALVFILSGYLMMKKNKDKIAEEEKAEEGEEDKAAKPEEDEVKDLLEMDTLELEIGFGLIPLVDVNQGGTLLNRIKSIRRQIALEMGFIVPPVRIRDNLQLETNSYNLLLKGVKCASGMVYPDKLMAMNPAGSLEDVEGVKAKEPAFGLPAKWIETIERENADIAGYTIVEPATIVATHLTEVIKQQAYELLGRQEAQDLLSKLKEKHPKIVDDLVPGILDIGVVTRVLQNLLRERVSVRNLQTILETLATFGTSQKDVDYLTEKVRFSLRRQITESVLGSDGILHIFTLPSPIEQLFAKSLQQTDDGKEIIIDPMIAKKVLSELIARCDKIISQGLPPVLVVSPPLRLPLRRFVDKYITHINLISHNEIGENVKIESLGTLDIPVGEPVAPKA